MMAMASFISFVALVLFITTECESQRRHPADNADNRGPVIDVRGLLSQIREFRNNIYENRQRVAETVLEPIGRIGRPHHNHRKNGRPNENNDNSNLSQRTSIPNSEKEEPTQKKKHKEDKVNEEEEVPMKFLPPPPKPGDLPPPPTPGGLPPKPSSGSNPSTEDWSSVLQQKNQSATDDLKRKIISAPCLGGIDANGECRASFD